MNLIKILSSIGVGFTACVSLTVLALGAAEGDQNSARKFQVKLLPQSPTSISVNGVPIDHAVSKEVFGAVVSCQDVSKKLWLIAPKEGPSAFDFEGFKNLTLNAPAGQQVLFSGSVQDGRLSIFTPVANTKPVRVQFPDGAVATMDPGSKGIYDLFKDDSYSFRADGKVETVNAEGQKRNLSFHHPPLTGGGLVRIQEKNLPMMQRVSPSTVVKISGPTSDPLIQIGDQVYASSNYFGQTLVLENGSSVQFKRGSLQWRVIKGDFRFSIAGIGGWHCYGFSGQSGSILWDVATKSVDLKNLTENDPLLVGCPSQTFALLQPKSLFQFSQMNSSTYAASGLGKVKMFSLSSGTEADLSQGNLLIRGGVFEGMAGISSSRNNLYLSWAQGVPLEINGSLGHYAIALNKEETLTGANSGQAVIRYSSGGYITIKALSGEFLISVAQIQNLVITLPEGDSITLQYDERKGVFLAQADSENTGSIRFDTPERIVVTLSANDKVTLMTEQLNGFALNDSSIIFYENAGGGESPSFAWSQTEPRSLNIPLFSRISQPPISVKQ